MLNDLVYHTNINGIGGLELIWDRFLNTASNWRRSFSKYYAIACRGITNIARGLALEYLTGKEQTGSSLILLVSGGTARIEQETQISLTQASKQNNVMRYWIYLRNAIGP